MTSAIFSSSTHSTKNLQRVSVTAIGWALSFILFFKIAGFFTLTENVALTRILKIFIRISMTAWVSWIYLKLRAGNIRLKLVYSHTLVPFLYLAYLGLGFASLMWSTNPGYSLLQWVMDFESLIFAWLFIATYTLYQHLFPEKHLPMAAILGRAVTWILAICLLGVLLDPDRFYRMTHGGEVARLGGVLMNPNELGMLAVIGLGMGVINLVERRLRKWGWLSLAICFTALVLTGSRSSMIGLFLLLVPFVQRHAGFKLKALIYGVMLLSIPLVVNLIFIKQGDIEEVLSMTGRLPFWKALLTEGLPESPWLGFGFMRIAEGDTFQSVHTYAGHMTHNTFIQVLMNLGFAGFLLVFLQLSSTLWAFIKSIDKAKRRFFLGLFIPILINSFTEFGIFGETNYGILFYQMLIFLFVIRIDQKKQPFPSSIIYQLKKHEKN